MESTNLRFGPYTSEVEKLLKWIDSGELLRFNKPLSGPFVQISDFDEALRTARRSPGRIDWTELRENADSAIYEIGLMNTPSWLPFKSAVGSLVSLVADKVVAVYPTDYPGILDDIIADLHACARCLAIRGKLDPFHKRLWDAYTCGGWPCGCVSEELDSSDTELDLDTLKFYVFWRQGD